MPECYITTEPISSTYLQTNALPTKLCRLGNSTRFFIIISSITVVPKVTYTFLEWDYQTKYRNNNVSYTIKAPLPASVTMICEIVILTLRTLRYISVVSYNSKEEMILQSISILQLK